MLSSTYKQLTFDDYKNNVETIKTDLRVPIMVYDDNEEVKILVSLISAKYRPYQLNLSHNIEILKEHVQKVQALKTVNNTVFIIGLYTCKDIAKDCYLMDKVKFRDYFRCLKENVDELIKNNNGCDTYDY